MNLSHVERYFADLLSLIESGEATELYRPGVDDDGETQFRAGVEPTLRLPPNLFIIGTVNVDETTYMFSPKVLDRANVIEFRIAREELTAFLAAPCSPAMNELNGRGSGFGAAFVGEAGKSLTAPTAVRALFEAEALLFFDLLRDHSAEFGFRVANEAARFLHFYRLFGDYADANSDWFNAAMDAVIVQKFLPKLHGSRPKLEGLLWALAWACGAERPSGSDFLAECRAAGLAREETKYAPSVVETKLAGAAARYPLSFEKVMRMCGSRLNFTSTESSVVVPIIVSAGVGHAEFNPTTRSASGRLNSQRRKQKRLRRWCISTSTRSIAWTSRKRFLATTMK